MLITGASLSIGLQFTVATAKNPEIDSKLKELSPWKIVQLDTSDEQSILNAAAALTSVPIDLLINNAGIYEGGNLNATTKANFMHQFEVKVTGPFLTTRTLLPNLKLSNGALVVQITSYLASIELNAKGTLAASGHYGYRESKAALNMVTKSLTIGLKGDRIGFLLAHPGYVSTDLNGYAAEGISVNTSVAGMAKVIEGCTLADSGKFLDYEGNALPW